MELYPNKFPGMLKTSPLDLLPEDVNSTCVKERRGDYCFLAGNVLLYL